MSRQFESLKRENLILIYAAPGGLAASSQAALTTFSQGRFDKLGTLMPPQEVSDMCVADMTSLIKSAGLRRDELLKASEMRVRAHEHMTTVGNFVFRHAGIVRGLSTPLAYGVSVPGYRADILQHVWGEGPRRPISLVEGFGKASTIGSCHEHGSM